MKLTERLREIEKHIEKIATNAEGGAAAPQPKRHSKDKSGNCPKVQVLFDDDYMDNLIK